MWKIKTTLRLKGNLKKHNVTIALLPTIGYTTDLYNHRSRHTIIFVFLFLSIKMELYFKY